MICFIHNDQQASSMCKFCGKRLCSECAIESASGIVCSSKCEARVDEIDHLVSFNIQAAKTSKQAYLRNVDYISYKLKLTKSNAILWVFMLLFIISVWSASVYSMYENISFAAVSGIMVFALIKNIWSFKQLSKIKNNSQTW